jgi:hypothetical protein
VVPTGAEIQVNGVSTPGIGNIVASGITLGPSQLNWNGSAKGGATVYPANLVQQVAVATALPQGHHRCWPMRYLRDEP